jgi:hypothetical protein
MEASGWSNPWKLTAIGMALVMITALVTGLVVANWSGPAAADRDAKAATTATQPQAPAAAQASPAAPAAPAAALVPPAPSAPAAAPAAPKHPAAVKTAGVPAKSAVDECNRYAASQVSQGSKTTEVVKDAAIGAVLGAAVGAAGGAVAGGGKGAGKGAAIGGVVGVGGGTLYGLNENKKHDEQYRAAYGACMRSRGYVS